VIESVESKEIKDRIKDVLGPVTYTLLKYLLRSGKLKIDFDNRMVKTIKDGVTSTISFDEIKQLIDELSD